MADLDGAELTRVLSAGPPLVVTTTVSKTWNEPVTLVTSTGCMVIVTTLEYTAGQVPDCALRR